MNTLAANVGPVSAAPGTMLHAQNWLITLTGPVPDRCRVVLGDPAYGQMVYVEECTGTGPYVCRLTYAIGRHHPAGTPVTVDSLMDQPLGVMAQQPDIDHVTYVTAADYSRLQAALDGPGEPNERIRREAQQMRQEREVSATWTRHLPPDARAEMVAELSALTGDERITAVAAWRATAEVYADPVLLAALTTDHGEDPMPERDGYTIGVYLPPGATEAERHRMFDAVADAAATAEGDGWDVHVVGVPGDPMSICHEPERGGSDRI